MSYILDALRRAEAQRQQQHPAPPGLGTTAPRPPALPPVSVPAPDPAPARSSTVVWVVAATAAGVLLALAAQRMTGRTTPTANPSTSLPAAPPVPTATALPTAPSPTEAAPAAPRPATPVAPMLQPVPEVAPARPTRTPDAPVQTPLPAPAAAVPRYAELPEAVRVALPAISVQGVTWSENPALRQLIVNGRVLQEGQSIGPDHVLEQIGRDGSVLNHRGQRYRIGH